MIIRLDLEKTYGQQNEDIAKKNKYDAVNMTVIDNYDRSYSDNTITLEETITDTNNQNIRENAILEEEWAHGVWAWETCNVKNPTYLIEVMYKNYSISISKSEYPELSQMRVIPTYEMYYDGDIYKEESNQSFTISSIYDFDDFKNYFDNLTLEGPLFSEITPITNNYTISKNIYTVTPEDTEISTETNIIDEISNTLQQGVKQTNTPNLTDMLNYVNAKIISITNNTDNVVFNVRCPYKIRVYQSDDCGCLDRTGWEGRYYGQVNSYNFNEYTITKLYINIYTEIQPETEIRKFFSGNREYSASSSFLFTENTNYPQDFAQQVYDAYNKGKLILNINYPINKLYDNLGNQIVYISGVGIARKVGDNYFDNDGNIISLDNNPTISYNVPLEEGYLCQIYKDGNSEYLNSDGSIKNFLIQSQSVAYTSVLINELKLIESMREFTVFTLMYEEPYESTITVYVSGVEGSFPSGSNISKGATLNIYADFEYGYGLVDNLMNINGQNVEKSANGYWTWTVSGDVVIKPNVVYLGGKYFYVTKDDDCTLIARTTPLGGGQPVEIESGAEIFTNQTIDIMGTISSNLVPRILVNGIEQEVQPSSQYDFYLSIEVENTDINVSIQTQSLARTFTVNIDDKDAIPDTAYPFLKVVSSKYNPDSQNADIYNNGTIYLEDQVEEYAVILNSGYSITNYTTTGLNDIGGNLLEVVDNVTLNYETTFNAIEATLYIFDDDIVYDHTKYPYSTTKITVTRLSSKAGGELGEMSGHRGSMPVKEDDIYVTKYYTGFDIFIADEISIKIEIGQLNEYEFVDATITAMQYPDGSDAVQFENGQSFIVTESYTKISATIE